MTKGSSGQPSSSVVRSQPLLSNRRERYTKSCCGFGFKMGTYHPGLPGGLPPNDAETINCPLWRGIKAAPLGPGDFQSEAEKGNAKADLGNPEWWGLSVWIDAEQAEQCRRLFKYMQRWHIARGAPSVSDCGVIKATPRVQNPHHHTWWKPVEYDPTPDFQIVFAPLR